MDFIVLCSSRGTTFQAVIDAMHLGTMTARCRGLVTDRPDRECIEKAQAAKLPFRIVERKKGENREEYDRRLSEAISSLWNQTQITESNRIIACIGWLHILSPWFVQQFPHRILNIHPSLLPSFGGKGMYGMKVHEAVLESGAHESGVTIHIVSEDVDMGPILVQKKCPVFASDTADDLKMRVQELEKEWFPKVLQQIEQTSIQFFKTSEHQMF